MCHDPPAMLGAWLHLWAPHFPQTCVPAKAFAGVQDKHSSQNQVPRSPCRAGGCGWWDKMTHSRNKGWVLRLGSHSARSALLGGHVGPGGVWEQDLGQCLPRAAS